MKINKTTLTTALIFVAFIIAGGFAAGCSKKVDPPKPKAECSAESDCPSGQTCVAGKCQTKIVKEEPKPECSADSDCEGGKECKAGKCETIKIAETFNTTKVNKIEKLACDELAVVHFDFDQYYLNNEAQAALKEVAECLKQKTPKQVKIEGHCDERGNDAYNLALGDKRAKEVKKYLVELGIDPKTLSTVSFGKEYAGRCTSEDCWYKDRKGVTKITKE